MFNSIFIHSVYIVNANVILKIVSQQTFECFIKIHREIRINQLVSEDSKKKFYFKSSSSDAAVICHPLLDEDLSNLRFFLFGNRKIEWFVERRKIGVETKTVEFDRE